MGEKTQSREASIMPGTATKKILLNELPWTLPQSLTFQQRSQPPLLRFSPPLKYCLNRRCCISVTGDWLVSEKLSLRC